MRASEKKCQDRLKNRYIRFANFKFNASGENCGKKELRSSLYKRRLSRVNSGFILTLSLTTH